MSLFKPLVADCHHFVSIMANECQPIGKKKIFVLQKIARIFVTFIQLKYEIDI